VKLFTAAADEMKMHSVTTGVFAAATGEQIIWRCEDDSWQQLWLRL